MMKRLALGLMAAGALALAACQQNEAKTDQAAEAPAAAAPAATTPAATPTAGAATGETCGTIAGIECASAGDFCKTQTGQCGVQDAAGVCTKKPEICTKEYMPVCGCDGQTYGNACEADRAGVNIASTGACKPA